MWILSFKLRGVQSRLACNDVLGCPSKGQKRDWTQISGPVSLPIRRFLLSRQEDFSPRLGRPRLMFCKTPVGRRSDQGRHLHW
jgi:hypothetical protein